VYRKKRQCTTKNIAVPLEMPMYLLHFLQLLVGEAKAILHHLFGICNSEGPIVGSLIRIHIRFKIVLLLSPSYENPRGVKIL
jgi:hypothetical protein